MYINRIKYYQNSFHSIMSHKNICFATKEIRKRFPFLHKYKLASLYTGHHQKTQLHLQNNSEEKISMFNGTKNRTFI